MNTSVNISLFKLNLKGFFAELHRQNQQRAKKRADQQDYRELAKQPDFILEDLGIKRSEINAKLDKPWWWS